MSSSLARRAVVFFLAYRLASHVYLCCTADQVVLLDLRRDRYQGIGPPEMHTLAECIEGWPAGNEVSPTAATAARGAAAADAADATVATAATGAAGTRAVAAGAAN